MSSSEAELYTLYRIANAPMREFPYPHIYVREVFPPDFYTRLRANLPSDTHLRTLKSLGRVTADYPDERLVLPLTSERFSALEPAPRAFWGELAGWLLSGTFGQLMIAKFAQYLQTRFSDLAAQRFGDEAMIVRDRTRYTLGPHTDSPQKVLSFLFYLPPDDSKAHLGTSIYVPKEAGFVCAGGPHYEFDRFRRMLTMEYLPNTLFAFMKTPESFHGVERITEENVQRDLLLYDIKTIAQPQAGAAPSVKFSF
jgi:hypothetical protein